MVDSTELSQSLGDRAMADLWAAHDRVARDLLPIWRGREIDKTDGMLLLFELAPDGRAIGAPEDAEKAYRVVRQGDRWLPLRQIANNLPAQLTSFVGRGRELAELKLLLHETRMITLLGMGGLGKTRLSLQLAAEQLAEFPDCV